MSTMTFKIASSTKERLHVGWSIDTGLRTISYDLSINVLYNDEEENLIGQFLHFHFPKELVALVLEYEPRIKYFKADGQFICSNQVLKQVDFQYSNQKWITSFSKFCKFNFYWQWKTKWFSALRTSNVKYEKYLLGIFESFIDQLKCPTLIFGKNIIHEIREPKNFLEAFHLIRNHKTNNSNVIILDNPTIVAPILFQIDKSIQIYFCDKNGMDIYQNL